MLRVAVIWGTTVNVQQAMDAFKKFFLGYKVGVGCAYARCVVGVAARRACGTRQPGAPPAE